MKNRLRLLLPLDADLPNADLPDADLSDDETSPSPTERPVPLMHFDIIQQTPEGPKKDAIFLWTNDDAKLCRYCTGRCTFIPGPRGQGVCTVRSDAASGLLRSSLG